MSSEPEPVIEPPSESAWLVDLTAEQLEIPDGHTEMRRLFRLLDRITRTEVVNALANSDSTHSDGRATVELTLDGQARLIRGRFTYAGPTGQVHDHDLTGVRVMPSGAIWISAAQPALTGWHLEAANTALQDWLIAAMGEELDGLLWACCEYGDAVAALAHHLDPNIPPMLKRLVVVDIETEARHNAAELAALLFTEVGSLRRVVATSIASSWEGTLAELLATTDDILTPAADDSREGP
ncbi:hypothetical protein [Nocardioides sp. Arc9.136]|uniref:hypothetical protein n=1 Tax=Nocardioides sp. Arc9.136 TaxID=2996826 RepID=UPI0026655B89|nr:hypothetical protein [Nocardioides sp. Arc9.136]WKN47458.1 hypothetical protein OSR43_15630 [Nocardioides sp. Arc9.136]